VKLDHDLVREILIQIEEKDQHLEEMLTIEVGGRSRREINYHLCKLAEGGLIDGFLNKNLGHHPDGREFLPRCLTFPGHEYLNAIRSDTIWRQVKSRGGDGLANMTFGIIQSLATKFTAAQLGLL
jgi:hypothetical protein